jgi:hypothetical protein
MMMRPGFGIGMDRHGAGPEFGCAGARVGDRGSARHPGSLRGIEIKLRARNDLNSMLPPILFFGGHSFLLGLHCGQLAPIEPGKHTIVSNH